MLDREYMPTSHIPLSVTPLRPVRTVLFSAANAGGSTRHLFGIAGLPPCTPFKTGLPLSLYLVVAFSFVVANADGTT